MVLQCAVCQGQPSSSVTDGILKTADAVFPLQTNHVGVLNEKEFPVPWTPPISSLILPVFPHLGLYQLSPTGPSPRVVEECEGGQRTEMRMAALGRRQHLAEKLASTWHP